MKAASLLRSLSLKERREKTIVRDGLELWKGFECSRCKHVSIVKSEGQALTGVAQLVGHLPESKRSQFDSQSGHRPGLQVRSPVGACTRNNRSMFLSLSLSLPSPLSKNK